MTTEEFYLKVGGDWQDELKRFGSEELVKRFIYKFVNDMRSYRDTAEYSRVRCSK